MNKIIKTLSSLSDKLKVGIIFGISTLLVVTVGIIGVSLANIESGVLIKQEKDGLVFDKANIEINSNMTRYTVQVKNTNKEDYSLNTISVEFINKLGETEELIGYIGNTIKEGETKLLDVSVDKELKNLVSISYNINN